MSTVKYKRPSGSLIEISDTPITKEFAKANGWVKVKSNKKEVVVDTSEDGIV